MPSPIIAGGKRSPLSRLQALVTELGLELMNSPPADPDEYVPIILGLKQALGELAVTRREAERLLIGITDRGEHRAGPWTIRRGQAWDRRDWQHAAIAGELRKAGAGLLEVVGCAGISYWRGDRAAESGTFEWGVDRDEFCAKRRVETVAIEKGRL